MNVEASNLVDYLADKIQNSGHQNQVVPYFSERVWYSENYSEILSRNLSAKIKYQQRNAAGDRLQPRDVLGRPALFLLLLVRLHNTKVMEQEGFLYFMSLCYMRIKVGQSLLDGTIREKNGPRYAYKRRIET